MNKPEQHSSSMPVLSTPHNWLLALPARSRVLRALWQRMPQPPGYLRCRAWLRQGEQGPRRLTHLCALTVLLGLVWAFFAQLDEIARGSGQVVPSQRVQVIQNLEGGILQALTVREGQIVEQGDLLARIDNEAAGSQYREALARSLEHMAAIARLEATIQETEPVYPPDVQAQPELVRRQNDILEAQRLQSEAEWQLLRTMHQTKLKEAEEQREKERQLATSLQLAEKQMNLARTAMQAKAYSAIDFLNLEQRVQNLRSELAVLAHAIPRLEALAQEAAERLHLRRAELTTQYRKELQETEIRLLSLRELLTAGSDKVQRTEVRSPVRGTVKKIYLTTVGGVIAPGGTIMEVVPLDDTLIVDARFSPSDIAFLYPGQKAIVRLSAYDFAIYGGMDAKVEHISADTLESRQGEIFYQVKVRTTSKSLTHKGKDLPILAGMMADVDVITGKKSVMDYMLKPLLKVKQKALSER